MPPGRRPTKRRGLRAALHTLTALALLVTVLLPAAFGGLGFVWCAPLDRVHATCCCRAARAALRREAGPLPAVSSRVEAACCEGHRVDSLPPSLGAHAPDDTVPPCVPVALGPPGPVRERVVSIEEPCAHFRAHLPRAGPTAPLFTLHCRYLI